MAVNFTLLPQEEVSHDRAPSRFAWTIAFFVMVLGGVFAVLLLWPKGVSTQTWKFWASLVLFPVGIPAWVVLRRYSVYEGRKLDADLHNEAVRAFNEKVFDAARIPLAVLGCGHRISADAKENSPDRIRHGAVTLKAQDPIAKHGQVVKARWLSMPNMPNTPGGKEHDQRRRQHVTAWLFNQLIDELMPCIQALPDRVPLVLKLSIANGCTQEENERLWRTTWHEKTSRYIEVTPSTESPIDLMMLDSWMDVLLKNEAMDITLLVAVQLHPLLARTPPNGAAETGVAILLAPEALARKYSLPRLCNLHRPVRATAEAPGEALLPALRWADVTAEAIGSIWQTGLDANQASALRESARKRALNALATDLDQTVGYTGVAAPWLATALAASFLASDATEQIILARHGKYVDAAIARPVRNG